MEILIREASNNDIEALVRCHSRFMEHHINVDKRFKLRTGAEEKWPEQIVEAVESKDTLVLIAETDKAIVGCAYIIIKTGASDFGPEKIGYLCDVFVGSAYRRQGIAKRFLSRSIKWLKEKDIHVIEASWSVYSAEAKSTWPLLGFEPISISGQMEF